MADPVRVQREESFQTSGPPAVLTVGYVHPDDLARAIRREMAAEVEIIRDDLRKGIDVDDALRWSRDRLTAPAPREPAQERQDAAPLTVAEVKDMLDQGPAPAVVAAAELFASMPTPTPDARAAGFAEGVEAAATCVSSAPHEYFAGAMAYQRCEVRTVLAGKIRALTPPTPTPDPLLPGLRAARTLWLTWCASIVGPESFEPVLDAEIARREGGLSDHAPPEVRAFLAYSLAAAIRAAVAAETERCADIADGYTKRITQIYGATNATAGALDACAGISRAIREAPPPQETQT